ncbi:MAG: beta-galactosidase [Patescibacteria group bacterium]
MRRFAIWLGIFLLVFGAALWLVSLRPAPEAITYGVSFTKLQADELGLDWKKVYLAMLDDLGVRHVRLAAHWPMVEPERDVYDFSALDFQIREASERDAEIILAVGRRLPRWPECHTPRWVGYMSWEEQKMELRQYLAAVIERYKDEKVLTYWQVENEPYLEVFARQFCGELDEDFLKEEIALVRSLDPTRPVLVTDSGNLGTWYGAYTAGDAFGTSVYVHFWTPELGQFKTILPPAFYRIKTNLAQLLFGAKPVFLIELSGEPWLIEPIVETPVEAQLWRMDIEKFNDILAYAEKTRLDTQYLWGPEWWYYMKEQGHPEFWDRAKELFTH